MPVLKQAQDGHHFIHHFYEEHSTWQVSGDGVRLLHALGVGLNGRFETDLFMRLLEGGLVNHGSRRRRATMDLANGAPEPLRRRVREFHQLLSRPELDERRRALEVCAPGLPIREVVAQRLEAPTRPRWHLFYGQAYYRPVEVNGSQVYAEFGTCVVDFAWDRGEQGQFVNQTWFHIGDWYLAGVPDWEKK